MNCINLDTDFVWTNDNLIYWQVFMRRYSASMSQLHSLNSPLPTQNSRHFADDIFRCMFVNGMFCILLEISLTFVPKGQIDNNPALV